ncbi:MAG: DUF5686 family protein [Bacteroidales bacterium]|nr:DUF5686 family protein [Bacteroidales bacterium]
MIRATLLLLSILLTSLALNAQVLKGRVTNDKGEAVQYATIYIQELRQGTTATIKGDYELKLAPGKYQVTYQSLGYGQVVHNIAISGHPVVLDVVLPLQYYMIPEVRITATGEDPAYGIMRKAIGMAPYYLNNISYYKADVYLKGNVLVNKISGLIKAAMKKAAKEEKKEGGTPVIIKEGDVYLMESYNEIEFIAPDKYVQKVISINSTFPDSEEGVSPMDFINASFYQPLIADMAISPLSPQAFSYYKFQYQGATPQGSYTINKIRVIPRMKSQQLFEGTIYIIENLWCIQSLDLTNDNIAGKINVQQLYIPVRDDIWMPVSHKFIFNLSIVGVRADVGYSGSVKYLEVRPNTSLKKPESVTFDFYRMQAEAKPEIPVSKNQQKIEELLRKDDLNNRDMVKLSKIMDQESKKAQPDSIRNNLEITNNVKNSVEKDANKKDSTYWAEIRPIPLSDIEIKSIRLRDSIQTETTLQKSQASNDSISKKQKSKFMQGVNNIATGHTWSDSTGFSFNLGGLIEMENLSFNTVDGFKYGIDFRFTKSWKENRSLTIAPDLKWAFSREALNWRLNGTYSFNRMKQRSIYFNSGMTSKDISTGGSINLLLNSIGSLFFESNYLKLYDSRYIGAGYRSEIVNGLNFTLFAGYEDRRILENTTSFSFINTNREYSPNIPDNRYLDSTANKIYGLRDQRHLEFVATLTYTPMQRYSIRNGAKVNRGSDWPTFGLTWEHGINEFSEFTKNFRYYDMIKLDISRNQNIGAFTELNWRVRAGGFLNNSYVTFYDFFHFNTQPLYVLIDDYRDAFKLPAYYSLSTPEFFGEVHVKYTTPYLLLKYLPGLSKTLMRENLSLSYLGSRFHKNYTEIGYSISEIFFMGELGVFTGFEDLKFKSAGVRFILKFN